MFARWKAFVLGFSPPPSLICKITWHPDPVRWLFWDVSLPSSLSAGFPNKVAFIASTPRLSDLLACYKQRELGVTVTPQPRECEDDRSHQHKQAGSVTGQKAGVQAEALVPTSEGTWEVSPWVFCPGLSEDKGSSGCAPVLMSGCNREQIPTGGEARATSLHSWSWERSSSPNCSQSWKPLLRGDGDVEGNKERIDRQRGRASQARFWSQRINERNVSTHQHSFNRNLQRTFCIRYAHNTECGTAPRSQRNQNKAKWAALHSVSCCSQETRLHPGNEQWMWQGAFSDDVFLWDHPVPHLSRLWLTLVPLLFFPALFLMPLLPPPPFCTTLLYSCKLSLTFICP